MVIPRTVFARSEMNSTHTFGDRTSDTITALPLMTQIMSLLNLAPDIQEELLHLREVMQRKATIREKLLRPLTTEVEWRVQRRMWGRIKDLFL